MNNSYKILKRKHSKNEPVVNGVPGIPKGIDKVFRFMSKEEQDRYIMYSYAGFYDHQTDTILMGAAAIERLENYKKEMIAKYSEE